MKILNIKSLAIPEVKVVTFARFKDSRGYFTEHYSKEHLTILGHDIEQCNESFSLTNVMRGLHFQWDPYMGKLVRTVSGYMVDVVLDIRKSSPTFGNILLYKMPSLTHTSDEWIWVPPGFAHGNFFLKNTLIEYLCTGSYNPNSERSITPFSKEIDWSLVGQEEMSLFNNIKEVALISDKDKSAMTLGEWVKTTESNNF